MKIRRSILIPSALLVYLAFMSYLGYPGYKSGANSPAYYFGVIGITLAIIIALFFFIRYRERLRDEREADLRRAEQNRQKN